jgi:hypothetical protein
MHPFSLHTVWSPEYINYLLTEVYKNVWSAGVVGFQGSLGTLQALEHATHLYKLILKLIHPSPSILQY